MKTFSAMVVIAIILALAAQAAKAQGPVPTGKRAAIRWLNAKQVARKLYDPRIRVRVRGFKIQGPDKLVLIAKKK